jgi:hypothetical protein
MNIRKSKTTTLISAMRILSEDIESNDGLANMAILEAADRLEEMSDAIQLGICFAEEILIRHDNAIGRDRPAGKRMAELIESHIEEMVNLTT